MAEPNTLLRMLAEYCPVEFPQTAPTGPCDPVWQKPITTAVENSSVTIRFGDSQIGLHDENSELWVTICEARVLAIDVVKTAKAAAHAATLEDFNVAMKQLRAQYDNL